MQDWTSLVYFDSLFDSGAQRGHRTGGNGLEGTRLRVIGNREQSQLVAAGLTIIAYGTVFCRRIKRTTKGGGSWIETFVWLDKGGWDLASSYLCRYKTELVKLHPHLVCSCGIAVFLCLLLPSWILKLLKCTHSVAIFDAGKTYSNMLLPNIC
jgi:hypothetical protein